MLLVTLAALAVVPPSGLAFGPHDLVADGDGTVCAWTTKELRFDAAFTKKLNGDGLLGKSERLRAPVVEARDAGAR